MGETNEAALDEARGRIEALEREATIAAEALADAWRAHTRVCEANGRLEAETIDQRDEIARLTESLERAEERCEVVNDIFGKLRRHADELATRLADAQIERRVLEVRCAAVERQHADRVTENLELRCRLHSVTLRASVGLPIEVA